jgi:hypothetical protein
MYEQKETSHDKKFPDADTYMDSIRKDLGVGVSISPEELKQE